eukprot:gb/GECH01004072.1/.p1 GENE.gb/GECH01004072.1/~~gb/GECH01004072.1/.p1  ORF type:complete len:448 (+),score=132.76 gb/GECH01004072.1/:1-1344(+)
MSATIFEQTRQLHGDIERSERAIANELRNKAKTKKLAIYQEHYIREKTDLIQKQSDNLIEIYDDEDGSKKEEYDQMSGDQLQSILSGFDRRLAELREYHRRFPDNRKGQELEPYEDAPLDIEDTPVMFTGEESYGKYLDLHTLHQQFVNLKHMDPMDYFTYLDKLGKFHEIPRQVKNGQYLEYLKQLEEYLRSFNKRAQPLTDTETPVHKTEQVFEEQWAKGQVAGWNGYGGPDSPQSKKQKRRWNFCHSIALLESRITRYIELLYDVIEATKLQLQKKQTKTWEEVQNEAWREEKAAEDEYVKMVTGETEKEDEEESEGPVNLNPLNLPLGWDGKPIPYWLYKLHGLNLKFKCEICGNYTYYGPRAFERHFQEWRHAHGMQCLGIPNTRHFHHITKMADAIALWKKLQKESKSKFFSEENEEEMEDESGNVYDKKTYEYLKRQGLA